MTHTTTIKTIDEQRIGQAGSSAILLSDVHVDDSDNDYESDNDYLTCDKCGTTDSNVGYVGANTCVCERCDIDGDNYDGEIFSGDESSGDDMY